MDNRKNFIILHDTDLIIKDLEIPLSKLDIIDFKISDDEIRQALFIAYEKNGEVVILKNKYGAIGIIDARSLQEILLHSKALHDIYNIKHSDRGFPYMKFKDSYGRECSLQKSSAALYNAIWFGMEKGKLTIFEKDNPGKYIITDIPSNWEIAARMHLTQDQVKALLPTLQHFAETGELE